MAVVDHTQVRDVHVAVADDGPDVAGVKITDDPPPLDPITPGVLPGPRLGRLVARGEEHGVDLLRKIDLPRKFAGPVREETVQLEFGKTFREAAVEVDPIGRRNVGHDRQAGAMILVRLVNHENDSVPRSENRQCSRGRSNDSRSGEPRYPIDRRVIR